jgi:hypothetical protein
MCFLFSLGIQDASAQKKKKKKKGSTSAPAPKKAKGATLKSLTSKSVKMEGLFTLYKDTANGKVHMLIKEDQLNKDFIYFSYTENGIVAAGHFRGSFRGSKVFRIRKHFNQLEFELQNNTYYFDTTLAISKSKAANISNSIIASEKILNKDVSKGNFVINADALFLTEKFQMIKPPANPAKRGFSLGRLSKIKTKYKNVKNYPENMDFIVDYVYDNPAPRAGATAVTDPRSITITYQHSILAMPKEGFTPRIDDPRIGYFTTQVNDMTTKEAINYRDLVHRWRLVKKDSGAALSDPVKPIRYWIENTTPLEYRETIRQAALKWNKAFEKAGFKNAVEIEVQPDTATWDAGDIRYNVIRWTSSPNPPFGGYGPSFVNPQTGEILGADIMIEYVFVTNRIRYKKLYQTGALELNQDNTEAEHDHSACYASHYIQEQNLLGASYLAAANATDIDSDEFIKQSLHYLILHEMGHTLGLNHNMKATQLHSPAQLLDMELTQRVGLIGSVMDYPAINLHPEIGAKVQYFTATPGPYDLWAIEFGYKTELEDAKLEAQRQQILLSRSGEPALLFGNDADDMRFPGRNGIDPRVMIGDMSNDAITYASERIKLVQKIIDSLPTNYVEKNKSYAELRGAFNILSKEYFTQAGVISRYIGGVYVDRSFSGDSKNMPYTPVKLVDQKRAMEAMTNLVFAPDAMSVPNGFANYLQPQRRGFGFFFKQEDPKLHNRVLAMQSNVLKHLLSPNVLLRISDSKIYGNEYSVTNLFSDLNNAIFSADINSNVNSFRQNLQVQYLKYLAMVAGLNGPAKYNNIAKARAYYALTQLQSKIKRGSNLGDEGSKAHKKYLLNTIENYFDKK